MNKNNEKFFRFGIKKTKSPFVGAFYRGNQWGSNPRPSESQSDALTN